MTGIEQTIHLGFAYMAIFVISILVVTVIGYLWSLDEQKADLEV